MTGAIVPLPDTVDEMIIDIPGDNISLDILPTINTEKQLVPDTTPDTSSLFLRLTNSKDTLCFIAYRGANMLRPRWYLVQIRL